jgi:hypothetical protein
VGDEEKYALDLVSISLELCVVVSMSCCMFRLPCLCERREGIMKMYVPWVSRNMLQYSPTRAAQPRAGRFAKQIVPYCCGCCGVFGGCRSHAGMARGAGRK